MSLNDNCVEPTDDRSHLHFELSLKSLSENHSHWNTISVPDEITNDCSTTRGLRGDDL